LHALIRTTGKQILNHYEIGSRQAQVKIGASKLSITLSGQ
jgi:hypothetical protein